MHSCRSDLVLSVHDDLLPAAYALAHEIADNASPVSVAFDVRARDVAWRTREALPASLRNGRPLFLTEFQRTYLKTLTVGPPVKLQFTNHFRLVFQSPFTGQRIASARTGSRALLLVERRHLRVRRPCFRWST